MLPNLPRPRIARVAGLSLSASVLLVCAGTALGQARLEGQADGQAVGQADGTAKPYAGHKLVRLPSATRQVVGALDPLDADIWTHTIVPLRPIELRLSPEQYARFLELGLTHEVVHEDLQGVVDAERARIEARRQQDDLTFYDEYRTLDEYWARWQSIEGLNPAVARLEVIGQSLEGRDMPGFVLNGNGATGKPVMLVNACQHAREWVSPAATTYFIEQLVSGYGTDARITRLLDELEWVFVPMMNPDGFSFTWSDERFWRKNRRDIEGSDAFGVDLNRNWSVAWGVPGGSSDNPGSETFHGSGAFSEPELQAFTSWVTPVMDRAVVHLDIHTFGQLVLHPLGYTFDPSPDDSLFQELGDVVAAGIFDTTGATYRAAQGSTGLYLTSGSAKDWAYGTFGGGTLGWTIELRPVSSGLGGFDPAPDQIVPAGRELTEGVLRLAQRMADPLRFHVTPQVGGAAGGVASSRAFEVRNGTAQLDPSSVRGFFRVKPGDAFEPAPVEHLGEEDYAIELGALQCGDLGEFYVQARTTDGRALRFPEAGVLTQRVSDPVVVLHDACEEVGQWTAGLPGDTALRGQWALGVPEATTAQPGADVSPDGENAWITDPRAGAGAGTWDVDGGFTSLVSPRFDGTNTAGVPNASSYVSFYVWYSNDKGGSPRTDQFEIYISNNDGVAWTALEFMPEPTNAWVRKRYRIADFVEPTDAMRVKFVAIDDDPGSLVEAGIDEFVVDIDCDQPHPADLDRDGSLTIFDFLVFQTLWASGDPAADFDGDGQFTLFDFLEFQTLFAR